MIAFKIETKMKAADTPLQEYQVVMLVTVIGDEGDKFEMSVAVFFARTVNSGFHNQKYILRVEMLMNIRFYVGMARSVYINIAYLIPSIIISSLRLDKTTLIKGMDLMIYKLSICQLKLVSHRFSNPIQPIIYQLK